MDLLLIAFILIGILILLLVFSILKKLAKVTLILALLFILLTVITGGSIFDDFKKIGANEENSNLVLLMDNNKILTGFSEEGDIITLFKEGFLDNLDLDEPEELGYDNVYMIDQSSLLRYGEFTVNRKKISAISVIDFIQTLKPIESITYADLKLDLKLVKENDDIGAVLFAYIYKHELSVKKSPVFFFKEYKRDTIKVYPETLFYKFVKIVPISFIEGNLNKLKDKVEGTEAID